MKNFISEISISAVIIILLVLLINPFGMLMPNTLEMMVVVGLVILFVLFASFVWQENVSDEREALHRMMADRLAFLAGTTIMVIGVIVQAFRHSIDHWLLSALAVAVTAKAIGLIYGKVRH